MTPDNHTGDENSTDTTDGRYADRPTSPTTATDAEWRRIGWQMKRIHAELCHLFDLLNAAGVPQSEWTDAFNRMDGGDTTLRSRLESRYSREHPDTFELGVFYGTSRPYPSPKAPRPTPPTDDAGDADGSR